MRTPLDAIVGWLSILRHEDAEARHFAEGLKVIERNTMAQVQLIDDVLDVSRIVSGQLRVDIRACELTDVINAGVNVVRAAAEARGIALHVRLDPSASGASRLARMDWAGSGFKPDIAAGSGGCPRTPRHPGRPRRELASGF